MDFGFTTAAYVVAAVLFILSLGGLSGQESAKRAVWYGIAGMALAVFATLVGPGSGFWLLSIILIACATGAMSRPLPTLLTRIMFNIAVVLILKNRRALSRARLAGEGQIPSICIIPRRI